MMVLRQGSGALDFIDVLMACVYIGSATMYAYRPLMCTYTWTAPLRTAYLLGS